MPRGIYLRTPKKGKVTKNKRNKKQKSPQLEIDVESIMAAQQAPDLNIMIRARTELDIMGDILGDFETLTEDARYRVMQYFIDKYRKYITQTIHPVLQEIP